MERRETVGKIATDLIKNSRDATHSIDDQMKEQLSGYEDNVMECVKRYKKIFPGDFFVVIEMKREKLLSNVIRSYFFGRLSCPTPNYDQIVYKHHRKDDKLEFIWVIPDRISSKFMETHTQLVPKDKFGVLAYVLKFADGSLFRLAKELNKETLIGG